MTTQKLDALLRPLIRNALAFHPTRSAAQAMRFLGQIDSEDEADIMWGDVGLVYLYQCDAHPDTFHLELQCH